MGKERSEGSERRLRRDAADNAERLLAAAIRAGLAEGRQVPLARIAADAGVGVGTLYRRYPDREALLEALQVRAYRLLLGEADHAAAVAGTGREAVEAYLAGSFALRDQLVLPLHGAPVRPDGESARLRDELRIRLAAIVARGHEDGSVRSDVTAWTVVRFGAMLAQPLSSDPGWETSAQEQRTVFLRGIAGPTPEAKRKKDSG